MICLIITPPARNHDMISIFHLSTSFFKFVSGMYGIISGAKKIGTQKRSIEITVLTLFLLLQQSFKAHQTHKIDNGQVTKYLLNKNQTIITKI